MEGLFARYTVWGAQSKNKEKRGYKNIPKTKNENVEDDDDEEVDESADEEKEEDGEKTLSTKDSVKVVEIDLTDHQFRGQLLRFIDKVWTFFDFDVFGTEFFKLFNG
jgi:hypothetical protein